MQDCKSISTPMASTLSIDKDEFDLEVDGKRYRGMIDSLLYLIASRPDIMFSVCMCAWYQAFIGITLKNSKKNFLILSATTNFGLWYPRGSSCCLVGFSDSDFVGCKSDRKSMSGTCHLFGNCLILWHRKKQHRVNLSTTEAENVAAESWRSQILWIKQ